MKKLPKLTVGKSKNRRFKSQRLLFWESLGKFINMILESMFLIPLTITVNPNLLDQYWKNKLVLENDLYISFYSKLFYYTKKDSL